MSPGKLNDAGIDLHGAPPQILAATVEGEPVRVGNERRWNLRLSDGRPAVLGQLVEELTHDASVRRRYRRDVRRWAQVEGLGVARLIAWGPPDDAAAAAPWRVREKPDGERLDAFLDRRAPVDAGEASSLLAEICERVAQLHGQGLVIRDFAPSRIVLSEAGPVFVDIGLARVDILSTRTAASLVLEGSPYTAPELLMRTAVDGRADLYGLGVLAFRLLTGQLPFGDTHALLRPAGDAPLPSSVRPGIPATIDQLTVKLLSTEPGERPASAAGLAAILRGEFAFDGALVRQHRCQNCDQAMPLGQRLCLGCGRVGVQFEAASQAVAMRDRFKVVLVKAKEDTEWVAKFNELCDQLSDGEHPPLEFMVGDVRMYSKAEQQRRLRVPVTLFIDLDHETAVRVHERFEAQEIKTKVKKLDAFDREEGRFQLKLGQRNGLIVIGGFGVGLAALLGAVTVPVAGVMTLAFFGAIGLAALWSMRKVNRRTRERWGRSILGLRQGPAALAASDPLVAKLATQLDRASAPDVRAVIGDAALLVQRLVDHRAANLSEAAEINMALEPVEGVVQQIGARVDRLARVDTQLKDLDEGLLARELAASRAREEPVAAQELLLNRLDRLRELEEERAQMFAGLLDAHDLMRRSVELGLAVHDEAAEHERQFRAVLNSLSLDDD